jgi:hypothetical protein
MNEQLFTILVQVSGILAALIGGLGAVPIVNGLKKLMGLQGTAAIVLTVVFSVLWGIAELLVGGQLEQDALTLQNLAAIAVMVFTISQAKYNMISQDKQDTKIEKVTQAVQ